MGMKPHQRGCVLEVLREGALQAVVLVASDATNSWKFKIEIELFSAKESSWGTVRILKELQSSVCNL